MEREIIEFTDREEIAGIVCGYDGTDEWYIIEDDIIDQTMWTTFHNVILKRTSDGKFFETEYSYGSTESQDCRPYEDDKKVLKEVKPYEVTTVVYEWRG